MKRKVGELFGKPIVTGIEPIKKNEIKLTKLEDDKVKLEGFVNGVHTDITGGSSSSNSNNNNTGGTHISKYYYLDLKKFVHFLSEGSEIQRNTLDLVVTGMFINEKISSIIYNNKVVSFFMKDSIGEDNYMLLAPPSYVAYYHIICYMSNTPGHIYLGLHFGNSDKIFFEIDAHKKEGNLCYLHNPNNFSDMIEYMDNSIESIVINSAIRAIKGFDPSLDVSLTEIETAVTTLKETSIFTEITKEEYLAQATN